MACDRPHPSPAAVGWCFEADRQLDDPLLRVAGALLAVETARYPVLWADPGEVREHYHCPYDLHPAWWQLADAGPKVLQTYRDGAWCWTRLAPGPLLGAAPVPPSRLRRLAEGPRDTVDLGDVGRWEQTGLAVLGAARQVHAGQADVAVLGDL